MTWTICNWRCARTFLPCLPQVLFYPPFSFCLKSAQFFESFQELLQDVYHVLPDFFLTENEDIINHTHSFNHTTENL